MKTKFIILICAFAKLSAQEITNMELIEKAVTYYLDGGTNNEFNTLKKAFHKDATMKFISNDEYREVNALKFFEKAIKSGPKQDRTTHISYINISGNTANAKIEIEYSKFTITDYMNLLKIDGEWKIVNKIYFRKNKK